MAEQPGDQVVREREAEEEPVAPEHRNDEPPEQPSREAVRAEPTSYEPVTRETPVQEEVRPERRYHPPPPPEQPAHTSALALASTATGIAGWLFVPVIGAIAAIITGFLARDEIRRSEGRLTGWGWATAGLVLGWVQIGAIILFAIIIAATAGAIFL